MSASHPRGHWHGAMDDAHREFNGRPFTIEEFTTLLRRHVNPMEAARQAAKRRATGRLDDPRRKDDVAVGLRSIANHLLKNRVTSGQLERVGPATFRFPGGAA